jgi:dimethylhistidine N-methyltransferase
MAITDAERDAIVAALSAPQASIDPKYFYDAAGSALFAQITRLPEYYPTRTELAIMETHGPEMARRVGYGGTVIEPGAGNCEKARALCALLRPRTVVALDISADFLSTAARRLQAEFPDIDVRAVVADLHHDLPIPDDLDPSLRVVFYPGSSIGNFEPDDAVALLRRFRRLLDPDGALLIGIDLVKDITVLEAAYDDPEGVTAAFNLNVLAHLNHLIGSDFELRDWRHRARFNARESRIEMHLEASVDMWAMWPGGGRHFRRGERIHTENSYKYSVESFAALLARGGFSRHLCWTDARRWFAVFLANP